MKGICIVQTQYVRNNSELQRPLVLRNLLGPGQPGFRAFQNLVYIASLDYEGYTARVSRNLNFRAWWSALSSCLSKVHIRTRKNRESKEI